MKEWLDGWADRWMDGWIDGWMEGWARSCQKTGTVREEIATAFASAAAAEMKRVSGVTGTYIGQYGRKTFFSPTYCLPESQSSQKHQNQAFKLALQDLLKRIKI